MTATNKAILSHIGICTADLDESLRFYTEALGFDHERAIGEIGAPFDQLMELEGAAFCAHHLKSGNTTIELIGYPDHDVVGSDERRPMNQLGFTHMTLMVPDVDATCQRIIDCGGRVYENTRIESPYGPLIFCTDPDGVRIELMQGVE